MRRLMALCAVFVFSFVVSISITSQLVDISLFSHNSKVFSAEIGELGKLDVNSVKEAGVNANQGTINSVINIVFSIAGGLALLFVAIGGLRFILSRGDPQSTAQARNTVLFAVIGLIVTMFAYAIVRFVVGSL